MVKHINDKVYRIEFHGITARALRKAIDERKSINNRLVDAQMIRRMEDRLLRSELSYGMYLTTKCYLLEGFKHQC